MQSRLRAPRLSLVSGAAVTAIVAGSALIGSGAAQAAGPEPGGPAELPIVANARALTTTEIRNADITDTAAGRAALDKAQGRGFDTSSRSYRVYRFGNETTTVTADTPLQVITGDTADGTVTFQVGAVAQGAPVAANAGMAIPPNSAWAYNNDGAISNDVGSWSRDIWWTITKADNWKCSGCTAYDYWRLHGKMRAAVLTGSSSSEGYNRAWLELDRNNTGWSTPTEFESARPEESYAGTANLTKTWGFGGSFDVNIGAPPLTASAGVNASYGGSMSYSNENWHPVVRTETSSGGVQFCKYTTAEYMGAKSIAARVSARVGTSGSMGGWTLLWGMADSTTNCPTKI